jgi:hypothetical protein
LSSGPPTTPSPTASSAPPSDPKPPTLQPIIHRLQTYAFNLLAAAPTDTALKLLDRLLRPLFAWENLLLKHAQLALQREKLQRQPASQAAAPADQDFDNSEVLALMHKTYFADVDELEKSGKIVIPPP